MVKPRTVFILGAGASAHAGAPLMGNFFEVAARLQRDGLLRAVQADIDVVEKVRLWFQRAQSWGWIDIGNIEAILSALEVADVLGVMQNDAIDARAAIKSMQRFIAAVLEQQIVLPGSIADNGWASIRASDAYQELSGIIASLAKHPHCGPGEFGFITFNYDILLDIALAASDVSIDYCLNGTPDQRKLPLCKLHGSLHWFTNGDEAIVPQQLKVGWLTTSWGETHTFSHRSTYITGKEPPGESPLIVPPVAAKTSYHRLVAPVWRAASELLATATCIYVIGYSVPDSDLFFRHLFSLGTASQTKLEKIVFLSPDQAALGRFRMFLSKSAERSLQAPAAATFETALRNIEEDLQKRHARK